MCSSCIYFGYDEIWDGEEETGYFHCDKGNYNHIGWNKEPCKDFGEVKDGD